MGNRNELSGMTLISPIALRHSIAWASVEWIYKKHGAGNKNVGPNTSPPIRWACCGL